MKKAEKDMANAKPPSSPRNPSFADSAPLREKNSGWQTKTIGDVSDVVNGGTPKTGVREYWGGPHRWVTPAEMGKRLSPYIADTERTITDLGLNDSSARLIPPYSVILSSRAPIGHLVVNTEPMATNQGCKGLVPRTALDHKFLYYYLSSIVDLLNSLGTGATFKELSGGKLKEVPIPLPPLPEQQRIVGILDEAFNGIATAKASAEKNLQNARALFESHLHAVFTHRGPGWVEKRLEELGTTQTGSTPKSSEPDCLGNFIPFIKPADFKRDGTLNYENEGLNEQGLKGARKISAGSVLMVCIGATIGKCGYSDRDVTTNQQINALIPKPNICPRFIYYQMRTKSFQDSVVYRSGQATLPIINKSKWSGLPVWIPGTRSEQNSITAKLDALQTETRRLEALYARKLAALDELKTSLLHQAFSGQL